MTHGASGDAGRGAAETYRKADLRVRLLLFGDGVDTVGQLKGEMQRGQVAAELRRMRSAFREALESGERQDESGERQEKDIGSSAASLQADLQDIASFRSRAGVPALVTPAEAADALKMSVSSIYRAVRNGEVRAVRLTANRGAIRIPASELRRLSDGIPAR